MATTNATQKAPAQATAQLGSRGRLGKYIFLGVILVVLLAFPLLQFVTERNINFYLVIGILMLMYAAMASSWNILGGYTGYVSLGHNVFFGVGGYLSGMLFAAYGVSVFLTAPLAGLVASLLGLIVGFITLRVRGPSFIISTIALLLLVRIIFDNWDFVGGSNGLRVPFLDIPVEFSRIPYYYAMLVATIGAVLLSYWVKHSKLGLGLRAISQDETKAESAGIPTNFYKIIAYALSAFFVGAVGGIWAQVSIYLRPSAFFLVVIAARMVLMAILGGKGTIAGPVLGAFIIVGADQYFVSQFGESPLNIIGTAIIMILVLVFFPEGIVGSLRRFGKLPAVLDWD